MFTRYIKDSQGTKILLFYLILNGYLEDIDEEKELKLVSEEEEYQFGLKISKLYGIISYAIDKDKIEEELELIQTPIVCSLDTFEYHSKSKEIYVYRPDEKEEGEDEEDKELYINDLGVISGVMVIRDDIVISSRKARSFDEDGCISGFEDFKRYVLENNLEIDRWKITYEDKVFTVYYDDRVIYSAIEIDKTSTYKLVIYIIKKINDKSDVKPDRFRVDKYILNKEMNETGGQV
jgi:hypothetical protein